MQIQLDKYIFTMKMWSGRIAEFRKDPRIIEGIKRDTKPDLQVYWGEIHGANARSIIIETGFFWQAAHVDIVGLYQRSSLCTPQAIKEIEDFNAPVPAIEILKKQGKSSKYQQGECKDAPKDIQWSGVVLASQNPYDRSIRAVGSSDDYFKFYESACKFYGKNLFIKLHPWNSGETGDVLRKIAKDNGVQVAKINHRIIKHCKFVLVYNSTFSVDCMIRGVPIAQYAPGYFYQNPAVQFTNHSFPTEIKTDISFGYKTSNFLMWRYCFDYSMSAEKWIKMFEQIAKNREMFPISREFSYAENKL